MSNDIIKLTCDKCKNEYQIKRKLYNQRKRRGNPNYCKECMKIYHTENVNYTKQNMSDERKAEYSRKLSESNKNYWEIMDNDKKEARFNQLRKQNDDLQKSMTPKKRKEHAIKIAEGRSKMSEEDRLTMRSNMSKSMTKHHASMTLEEKDLFSQQIKDGMSKMTDKEKEEIRNTWVNWWNSLSDVDKRKHITPMLEGLQNSWNNMNTDEFNRRIKLLNDGKDNWWNSLSQEEKMVHLSPIIKKWHKGRDDWWDTLSIKEKAEHMKKSLSSASGKNNLHRKFETRFNESILINSYYIKNEIILFNDDIMHSWDYGIYSKSTNELLMVVDLDGSYFHADECDYNGIHSREEYDERRVLSIPIDSSIKHFIIQEFNFSKCFELMLKTLIMNYNDYIEYIFKMCRSMPFPSPKYSDKELIKSFNELIKLDTNHYEYKVNKRNTRNGDRLITHFHPSIYQAHRKGNISPYEAWYDDKLLKECIENRIIYQNYLNPNKILQGFNIAKIATKVSVFSAGRAKILINKYLSEFNEVFDPFSGFSGRMLGTISLGKKYIGQDISEIHVRESNEMIKFLNVDNVSITCKNILESNGEYECIFTCPPYSNKEQWLEVPVDTRTCDDWIDECLSRFKCKKYLFVVDDTNKYKNYIVDEIKNKSHFGTNSEYVILIERD